MDQPHNISWKEDGPLQGTLFEHITWTYIIRPSYMDTHFMPSAVEIGRYACKSMEEHISQLCHHGVIF